MKIQEQALCDVYLSHRSLSRVIILRPYLCVTKLFSLHEHFLSAKEQHIIQLTQKLITSITTGDFDTYRYLFLLDTVKI